MVLTKAADFVPFSLRMVKKSGVLSNLNGCGGANLTGFLLGYWVWKMEGKQAEV